MNDDGGYRSVLATSMRGGSVDGPGRLKLGFIAPVGWAEVWRRPYFAITDHPPLDIYDTTSKPYTLVQPSNQDKGHDRDGMTF